MLLLTFLLGLNRQPTHTFYANGGDEKNETERRGKSLPVAKKLNKTHTDDSQTHNTDGESSLIKFNLGVKPLLMALL